MFSVYQLARNLSQGHGFTTDVIYPFCLKMYGGDILRYPDMFSPPLFPFILSIFFFFLGAHNSTAVVLGCVLYLCCGCVLFIITRKVYDLSVAVIAALLFMCNSTVVTVAVTRQDIMLTMLLMTCVLLALRRISSSRRSLVSTGVLLGMVYLSRYELLFAVVPASVLLAWLLLDDRDSAVLMWFVVAFIVVVSPFMLRNSVLTGHPFYGLSLYKNGHYASTWQLSAFINPEFPPFDWGRLLSAYRKFLPYVLGQPGGYLVVFSLALLLTGNRKERNWYIAAVVMFFLYFCIQDALRERKWFTSIFIPFFAVAGTRGLFLLIRQYALKPRVRLLQITAFVLINLVPLLGLATMEEPGTFAFSSFRPLLGQEEESVIVTDVPHISSWFCGMKSIMLPIEPADFIAIKEEYPATGGLFLSVLEFAVDWPPDINAPPPWPIFYQALTDGYLPSGFRSGKRRSDALGNVFLHDLSFAPLEEISTPEPGRR